MQSMFDYRLFVTIVAVGLTGMLPLTSALTPPKPASPAPTIYQTASAVPNPPAPTDPYIPSIFDDVLLSIFRWTLQRQSGVSLGIDGFDGMMAELHTLRRTKGTNELARVSLQTMTALAGPIPLVHRTFFKDNEYSPALLALFARHFLPFLVGKMTLTSTHRIEDRIVKEHTFLGSGGGLLVERCRVLEGSNCKGICAKMCKVPTERFFDEQWGVPLTMEPNFETGACQLRFGVAPVKIEEDATIPPGCLGRCPAGADGVCD